MVGNHIRKKYDFITFSWLIAWSRLWSLLFLDYKRVILFFHESYIIFLVESVFSFFYLNLTFLLAVSAFSLFYYKLFFCDWTRVLRLGFRLYVY